MIARFAPIVLERAAFGAVGLVALSFAYERLDVSAGITPDLRLTNLRLVIAFSLGLWLLLRLRTWRWPRVPRAVGWPLLLWLGVVAVSALAAPSHQTQALAFTRDLLLGVALGWAAYDLSLSAVRRQWLIRLMALGGAGVGVLGLAEAAGISPIAAWLQGFKYQSFSLGEMERISSSLPHPNIAAMVLGLTVPLMVAWIVITHHVWMRVVLGLLLLAGVATMGLTFSRSGVLVLIIALGLMAGVAFRQRHVPVLRASLVTLGGLILVIGAAVATHPVVLLHLMGETADGWYAATYQSPDAITARPGESKTVPVRVVNVGLRTWAAAGAHPFALSYHLLEADDTPVTYDGPRTDLPNDVPPGSAVDVLARLAAPPRAGEYVVEWDEVQEATTWFSWAGTPPARTRLTVAGPPVTEFEWSTTPPPDPKVRLSTSGRLQLWRIALRMARNRPLLGVGPDNFRWVYGDFAEVAQWDTGVHANNLYVEWLADTGVLGLGTFGWFMWRLTRTAVRPLMRNRSVRTSSWVWDLALVASLASWFAHGLADYFYGPLTTNVAFWLVAGLALSAADWPAQPELPDPRRPATRSSREQSMRGRQATPVAETRVDTG